MTLPKSGPERRDPIKLLVDTVLCYGDIDRILPDVLAGIADCFASESAVLLLAEADARYLAVAASLGEYASEFPVRRRFRISPGSFASFSRENWKEKLETETTFGRLPASSTGAPMFVDGRFLGSIHLGTQRSPAAGESARLQGFADRIALALDHGRLYRAEREARSDAAKAERRFRDLVHNLDAIVWEANVEDWRFTFVSRRAEKMLGYPLADWSSTPDFLMQIAQPEDRAEIDRRRRHMLKRGRAGAMEFRVHAADGRILWIQALAEVARDPAESSEAGVPRRMRGLMLDVTLRREAERDAQHLAAIVESSDDAIIGKDLNATIRTWNSGAEKMYGYTAEEAVGRPISMLEPEHLHDEIDGLMRKLRAGERISHLETQRRRKDGEIIDVALTISPIRDAAPGGTNEIVGASTIARDITAVKRAERTLRNTERLAATGRLAASIAHEINNPMASVTNLLYLLEHQGTLDATSSEYVKLAQEELKRVTHIVRQMLGFYRESEKPVEVDPAEVIDNVLLLYSRRLQNTHIAIERDYRTGEKIHGFPGEIRQVFSNLLVNAIEAVSDARSAEHPVADKGVDGRVGAVESGRIHIDVRRGRDWSNPSIEGIRILVADNGPGIPEAARKRIFEPFFTTKGERGTGLGLWVSDGIVRKHGGSMRVRSSTGERHGTCFCIFFPSAQTQPANEKVA